MVPELPAIFKSTKKILRKTVQLWHENKPLYESHARALQLEYLWDDEFDSIEERLLKMKENGTYAGQPEISSLVHVIQRSIHVHYNGAFINKSTQFGEAFSESPPIHLVNYPDKGRGHPGHYDLMLFNHVNSKQPPLNLKHGDFVAIKAGPIEWHTAQITQIDVNA